MTKTNKKNPAINQELLKALISQAEGQDLFGQDGFFQHLRESLANCMLEG